MRIKVSLKYIFFLSFIKNRRIPFYFLSNISFPSVCLSKQDYVRLFVVRANSFASFIVSFFSFFFLQKFEFSIVSFVKLNKNAYNRNVFIWNAKFGSFVAQILGNFLLVLRPDSEIYAEVKCWFSCTGGWRSVRLLIRYICFRFTFFFLYIILFFSSFCWFRLGHKQPNVIAYLPMKMIRAAVQQNSTEHLVSIPFFSVSSFIFCNKHTISHFHFQSENTTENWAHWKRFWNGVSNKQCHEKWQYKRKRAT